MKQVNFDPNQLRQLIADALDGQIDETGRQALNQILAASAEARRHYCELMDLHARLHLEYTGGREVDFMPGPRLTRAKQIRSTRTSLWLAAAASIALLVALLMRGEDVPAGTFATLEKTHSSRWGASDLPTRVGSRLGKGNLKLEEGLAVIRFDSGAEVSLEAPVELRLLDAMNCHITGGIAVANVPETAIGFRIGTPSAVVVDYGTRFAVSVDVDTGGTLTQVFEGLVDVENSATGGVVSLKAGQRASVQNGQSGPVTEDIEEGMQVRKPGASFRGGEWVVRQSAKDAYTGYSLKTDSKELLYIKNGAAGFHRKAYLGFDLSGLDGERIDSAELMLEFEPTGLGLASHVPDSTFSVYGVIAGDYAWNEDTLKPDNAPANRDESGNGLAEEMVRKLGSFVVGQGVQRGRFGIDGSSLTDFLRDHAGSMVTLIVVRETAETRKSGLVHGIASRRHSALPGPSLAIRQRQD